MTPSDLRLFAIAWASLTMIGMARGQGTYWVARLAAAGTARVGDHSAAWHHRIAAWLTGPKVEAGRRALGRWGLPLISLCYLTFGLQTIVLASAGVLRIGWVRFTLAQLPGAAAWGLIYSTIGFAAWEAAIGAAISSPLGLGLLAALATIAVTTFLLRRRSRQQQALPGKLPPASRGLPASDGGETG